VQKIALRNLLLRMRFMDGVELRRAHRVKPMIFDLGALPLVERGFDLKLGDMARQTSSALMLELVVPPRPEGNYQLAHLVAEYDVPHLGIERQKQRANLIIPYTANHAAPPLNPTVMNLAEKLSAFKLQTRALQDAANGDLANATRKLQAAATRLINMGEQNLAQQLLNEAANLEQRGRMSAEGTKRLRYNTRKLTQQLE